MYSHFACLLKSTLYIVFIILVKPHKKCLSDIHHPRSRSQTYKIMSNLIKSNYCSISSHCPPHPHPKSPHHNWICLHFNIATATDETKSKWNCVFLIFSTQNITSHTSHHISISKSCSPKSVLKCVETFSLLFVCPHFFRIFGPIRPARGRASTHIFECRKTYRTKIPLAWKYLLNPKIVC